MVLWDVCRSQGRRSERCSVLDASARAERHNRVNSLCLERLIEARPVPVVRTSDKWPGIIRWVAAVSPATGFPLFRPVLTQSLSLSPLTIRAEGCEHLVSSSARVGGPCGRTGSFHQESDLLVGGVQLTRSCLMKRATQSVPTRRESPNGWEKTTQ